MALVAVAALLGCGRLGFESVEADQTGQPDSGATTVSMCEELGCSVTTGWLKPLGSTGVDFGFGAAADAEAVYLTGFFTGADHDFGGGSIAGPGIHDAMVVKYRHDGSHVFSRRLGGDGFNEGFGIAAGPGGNVFAIGHYEGEADFGGGPRPAFGSGDVYMVSFDGLGNHRYSVVLGGSGSDDGRAVAVDAQGNAYFVGWFVGEATFPDGTRTAEGGRDTFVVSLDVNGDHRWTQTFGSEGDEMTRGIAVSGSTVVVSGVHQGNMTIGGKGIEHLGGEDAHLVAFDAETGKYGWHKAFGGPQDQGLVRISATENGNFLTSGFFLGALDVFGKSFESAGDEDVLLLKFAPDGALIWSRSFGGEGKDRLISVASGPNGEIVGTGIATDTLQFASSELEHRGDRDVLVVALSADGDELWGKTFGGPDTDEGQGLAVDASGRVYVTGSFRGRAEFSGEQLEALGSYDTFLIRLDPSSGPR